MEKLLPTHTGEDIVTPQIRWDTAEHRQNRSPRKCLLRHVFIALVFLTGFYLLVKPPHFRVLAPCHLSKLSSSEEYSTGQEKQPHGSNLSDLHAAEPSKIPLEAHIMSKCPDARSCLKELILPTMEQVSDKVDFQLSFIAK